MIGGRRITGSRVCAAHGIAKIRTTKDADMIIADVGVMAANVTRKGRPWERRQHRPVRRSAERRPLDCVLTCVFRKVRVDAQVSS